MGSEPKKAPTPPQLVKCGECGAVLPTTTTSNPDNEPCPTCGKRAVRLGVDMPTLPIVQPGVRGGIDYGVGRTAVQAQIVVWEALEQLLPLPADQVRVLLFLHGEWERRSGLRSDGAVCHPRLGIHPGDCPHRWPTPSSQRAVALACFGGDGGDQLRRARDAITALYELDVVWEVSKPGGRETTRSRIFATFKKTEEDDRPDDATFTLTWNPDLLRTMYTGDYLALPEGFVTKLRGRSALRIWVAVLTTDGARNLRRGETTRLAVTGPSPTLPVARLGLSGVNRPSKVRAALERAFEEGHKLQDEWHAEVVDRAGPGFMVELHRRDPDAAPAPPVGPSTAPPVGRRTPPVGSGTKPRRAEDAPPLGRGHTPRRLEDAATRRENSPPRSSPRIFPRPLRASARTSEADPGWAEPNADGDTAKKKTTGNGAPDTAIRLPSTQTRGEGDGRIAPPPGYVPPSKTFSEAVPRPGGPAAAEPQPAASSGSPEDKRGGQVEPGVAPGAAPGVLRGAPVSGEPREQEEP